jgi:hypothetical protein
MLSCVSSLRSLAPVAERARRSLLLESTEAAHLRRLFATQQRSASYYPAAHRRPAERVWYVPNVWTGVWADGAPSQDISQSHPPLDPTRPSTDACAIAGDSRTRQHAFRTFYRFSTWIPMSRSGRAGRTTLTIRQLPWPEHELAGTRGSDDNPTRPCLRKRPAQP